MDDDRNRNDGDVIDDAMAGGSHQALGGAKKEEELKIDAKQRRRKKVLKSTKDFIVYKDESTAQFYPSNIASQPIMHSVDKSRTTRREPSSPQQQQQQQQLSQCKHCLKTFSRVAFYIKHVNASSCMPTSSRHYGSWCSFCDRYFATEKDKLKHEKSHLLKRFKQSGGSNRMSDTEMIRSRDLHGCKVLTKTFEPGACSTIESAFLRQNAVMYEELKTELRRHKIIKFGTVLEGDFVTLDENGDISERTQIPMRSAYQRLLLSDERRIKKCLAQCQKETLQRLDDIQEAGSGWILNGINHINIEIGKCSLIGGADKKEKIKVHKGAQYLLDIPIEGERCFVSAFAQHFLRVNTEEETEKWIKQTLDLKNIKFPMSIHKIRHFEKRHRSLKTGINVFLLDGTLCYPVHKSTLKNPDAHANLLMVPYLKERKKKHHFMFIKDLNKFLSLYRNQLNNKRKAGGHFCFNCLTEFSNVNDLAVHHFICLKNQAQAVVLPDLKKKITFDKHLNKYGHEFIGVADFEASLVPYDRSKSSNCKNCRERGDIKQYKHATMVQNDQIPNCYSLVFVDRKKNVVFQRTETGPDVMPLFFKALKDAEDLLLPQLQAHEESMYWCDEYDKIFASSVTCHVCNLPFEDKGKLRKVRDHDHKTGLFVGAAHHSCNVLRRVKKNLLVYMHNFSGYDSHFIVKHYNTTGQKVKALAYNSEKFRTLTLGKVMFVDSLNLLNASLGELVSDLVKENHSFPILESSGIYETEEERDLLIKGKGIYPYEYVKRYDTLLETKLPPREAFYSLLRDETVSEADYNHAVKTFDAFRCSDLRDYTRLYCLLDTLQLAEVITEFVSEAMQDFGLCPTNYISLPQLSFDAMLKLTKITLDHIPDEEMIMLFESSIRGGVSYVNTRIINIEDDGGIIEYIDANNLYGKAQQQFLPTGGYRWLTPSEILEFTESEIMSLKPDSCTGYVFEVKLSYPEELRKLHAKLP